MSISPSERRPFIGGSPRSTGEIHEIRSPFDGSVAARVHRCGRRDVEEAIASAVSAFEKTRRLAAYERSAILEGIADRIASRIDELAGILVLEAGKPLKAARLEAERSVHTFRSGAEEARRLGGEILPLDTVPWGAGRFGMTRRFPIGPVSGITPFNFPLNLTAHKIAPAIASGCSIVIKPATQTPSAAILLAEMAAEAGAPPGSVSVVTAAASNCDSLVTDDRLKLLTFTGSPAVGWDLRRRAGKKKVTLELGGNAAVIVRADADLSYAVERVLFGGYGYAGQSCISVQRVFVERGVFGAFVESLVPKVKALKTGDPADPSTEVGPLISEAEAGRAESWIREAVDAGAKILTGGKRDGSLLTPAVLTETRPEMKVNCREIFAPVLTVTPFEDFESALAAVNDSPYGLQAGIFTRDAESAFRAFEALDVGGVMINDVSTFRVDHMPYGGVKDSGAGREGLRWAIEEMTEPRLMVWNRRAQAGQP